MPKKCKKPLDKNKELEKLLAICHKQLESSYVTVTWNDHQVGRLSESRRQIDVSVREKENPSKIPKIIEVRDHKRKQNVMWIGQLDFNRKDVGAEKVIGVDTKGYSAGAQNAAEALGNIELRTIKEVDPKTLGWNKCEAITFNNKRINYEYASIDLSQPDEEIPKELMTIRSDTPIFKFKNEDKMLSTSDLFGMIPEEATYGEVKPGGLRVKHIYSMSMDKDNPIQVVTPNGVFDIDRVTLSVEMWIEQEKCPVKLARCYQGLNGEVYTEMAEYEFTHDGKAKLLRVYMQPLKENGKMKFFMTLHDKDTAPDIIKPKKTKKNRN